MFPKAKWLILGFSVLGLLLGAACVAPRNMLSGNLESGERSMRDRLQIFTQLRQANDVQPIQTSNMSQPGLGDVQTMRITQDGRERMFLVHVPAILQARPAVVLVLHGGGGSAERTMEANSMRDLAERGGFLAVYPDSGGERWNDGRIGTAGGADDVGFMRAIIATLEQDYGADRARVFATGISNGGVMAHKLACDAPDLVAAIAPVAANMPVALRDSCAPAQGTPVMMFNGTDDPLMPYLGGRPELDQMIQRARGPSTDEMTSSPDTAAFWARVNGCLGSGSVDLGDTTDDDTTVTQISYDGCIAGQVVLYRINGGGHSWPGADVRARRITGNISKDIDASTLMVRFFQRYGL